jgi:hyperosmotically inducible periplasmic protein
MDGSIYRNVCFFSREPGSARSRHPFHWQEIQQPDNSKNNQNRSSPTADQHKSNASDQAITRGIRKSIMSGKSLSTYAHNVKIITQNGKVTLRGPVRSDEERANIE